jgi:curved DNA-binding protein CbpA
MIDPAGDVRDLTVPWLFQGLKSEKKTATVIFARDASVIKVYFKDGDVLFASSSLPEDRLGEYLLRTGKITKVQFDKASEVVISTGKKLGAALFEMGALTSHDLVDQVRLQVKEIILRTFGWRDGRYIIDNSPLPLSELIPLHMSAGDLIIEGVRELDWKIMRASLPPLNTILRPVRDPSRLFQSARLDENQRAVFTLVDGSKSMNEICCLSGIGEDNTLKALYALLALRMVETGAIKNEDEKTFVCEAVRAAVAADEKKADGPKDAASAAAMTRGTIRNAYELLALQNHYEVLGVGKSATPQEIKKAYFFYAKLYHPDRHFDPEMQDMKDLLEALFARIHDAYETLSTPEKRDQYNVDLASGSMVRRKKPAAREQPDKSKAAAQAQFNEGIKQFSVGNFWGANDAFEWAMRLDPGTAAYVFHRGLSLSRIPRRGHEAEEYFVKAISMDPGKIEYRLELGNFYQRSGLKAKALDAYRRALEHDPHSEKLLAAIKKAGG